MRFGLLTALFCVARVLADDGITAIRNGDAARLKAALDNGMSPNMRNDQRVPALMLAALYADAECMRLLLERGADPNLVDPSGATALMWSVSDIEKARLLVERGAKVNAVTEIGRSALLIAAGRPRSSAVVQYLLSKGANPKIVDKRKDTLLHRAAYSGDIETLKLALDQGLDVNAVDDYGWTPLMEAALQQSAAQVKLLLSRGADPSIANADGATALLNFGPFRSFETYEMLLRAGAKGTHRDKFGRTLLVAAAASDTTTPEVMQALLAAGHDPKIKTPNLGSKDGETALDWAFKRGDTPAGRLLGKAAGIEIRSLPNPPLTLLRASSAKHALNRSLALLAGSGPEFVRKSGCVSCHHQSLPLVAFGLAAQKGIRVDEAASERTRIAVLSVLRPGSSLYLQDARPGGGAITAAYMLFGLAGEDYPADWITDAMVHWLAVNQSPDGSWRVEADRPPMEYSRISVTALAIFALKHYGLPGRIAEMSRRIDHARDWLIHTTAETTEERVFRLLGLVWAKAGTSIEKKAADELLAAQRADGGWAQLPSLSSDAYATGQAVYALHSAGRLNASSPEHQKAIRFLLDTQVSDGSWFVRSRSYPVQPKYFDTGFPHGVNQWISAAGTAWASIALALSL